jgi:hypothetical protein
MNPHQFEGLLEALAQKLTIEARRSAFANSKQFENRARQLLSELGRGFGVRIDFDPHPYVFPDICIFRIKRPFTFSATKTFGLVRFMTSTITRYRPLLLPLTPAPLPLIEMS